MSFGGLDVGTSGCKCTLFDDSGKQLAVSYRAYKAARITGHHEIDVTTIWDAAKAVITEAAKETCEPLEALCISSFGESCAFLDKNDTPVIPAMLYTDPRGSEEADILAKNLGDFHIYRITGHRSNSTYTLPKLIWTYKHLSDRMARVEKILPITSFITYHLTGETVSDPSLAARTMMLDIKKLRWSEELLDEAGISEKMLPGIVDIGTVVGTIRKTVAEELGVLPIMKVVMGAHDQIVAAIGAGVLDAGLAVNSSGTVECITPVFEKVQSPGKLFRNHFATIPMLKERYATYATVFSGGILLQWFRDNFTDPQKVRTEKQNVDMYEYLDSISQEGPTGILVLPHFVGSASPYYDSGSKGAIVGLTLEHTAADIYRALQEGICYEVALNLELLAGAGIRINSLRIVGGGEKSRRWNQMKSDIYGIPCTTLKAGEAGATGSAMLAGVALGKYSDLEHAVSELVAENETFMPRKEYTERYTTYFERYKNLYKAVRNI